MEVIVLAVVYVIVFAYGVWFIPSHQVTFWIKNNGMSHIWINFDQLSVITVIIQWRICIIMNELQSCSFVGNCIHRMCHFMIYGISVEGFEACLLIKEEVTGTKWLPWSS